MPPMNYLLKNARLLDPANGVDLQGDLAVTDGVITAIGKGLTAPPGAEVHDLSGQIVAPGFIDMHVHLREPGFEHKETIATGCASAAAGGFTAVCCMPNTQPAIDDATVVRTILERAAAAGRAVVDVYPIAAVTKGREGKVLAPMIELAASGAVGFSDDGAPVADAEVMRRALEYAGMLDRPVIQHAEETSMTKGGAMSEGFVSTALGMPAMPPAAEDIVVARDLRLVESFPARYHVAHISTRGAVEMVRRAKSQGLPVTCEVTPHHFTLTDEAVRSFDTNTKMNPPLRSADDVAAMKEGLRDGTIDVIATDHAPHSYDEKEVEYVYAPFGIVGLETAIGLAVTELVATGVLTLAQLVEKLSTNPRRILGLPKVELVVGAQANLTIFDPQAAWTVDVQAFRSKSKNSPFHGTKLTGRASGVLNHGILLRF
jgi:dihydroorotase